MVNGSLRTVSDIITRVQRTFGDEANIQVTEADVIRWVNDACAEVVMQHENLLVTEGYINSVEGTNSYELPADCYIINEVYYRADENSMVSYGPLKFVSNQELSAMGVEWNNPLQNLGTPEVYLRGPNGRLFLYPAPDKDYSNSILINYNRYPVAVTSTASEIDLPPYYHGYVEHFCMMKAYEMDEDWGAADRKAQLVQSTIDFNNSKEQWFGQQSYPVVSSEY